MTKKEKQPILDQHLFRQEMGDIVPLKTASTTESRAPRKLSLSKKPLGDSFEADKLTASSTEIHDHIDSEDGTSHRKNGVQKRMVQKLKRGQFPVTAQLDLHSMTVKAGHDALMTFIHESGGNSIQSVRVIHGKGLRSSQGPRLKIMARQLLREHPKVLAFSSCKPAQGGDGATDVLLKSS